MTNIRNEILGAVAGIIIIAIRSLYRPTMNLIRRCVSNQETTDDINIMLEKLKDDIGLLEDIKDEFNVKLEQYEKYNEFLLLDGSSEDSKEYEYYSYTPPYEDSKKEF
jgi:hypothetical protein